MSRVFALHLVAIAVTLVSNVDLFIAHSSAVCDNYDRIVSVFAHMFVNVARNGQMAAEQQLMVERQRRLAQQIVATNG